MDYSKLLNGKVCIITGGARGQGFQEATLFKQHGGIVYITDILDGTDAAKSIGATYLKHDVTSESDWSDIVSKVASKNGGRIDVLINNAGISIPTSIEDENYDEYWDNTFNVLLKAQVRLIRETLPFIQKSDSGRIVNISSTEGLGATPKQSPYTSAKHGVIGLTRSLAAERGSTGVTINCICPGPIRTGMTKKIPEKDKELYARRRVPLKRYGEAEEVAHATLNFCLPSSSFINGAVLPVDGGLTIKRA